MRSHVPVINLHQLFDIDLIVLRLVGVVDIVDEAVDCMLTGFGFCLLLS